MGEIKEMSKTKKLPSGKKIVLELLHQRLGHRSTRSLLTEDTAYILEDIDLRIYPDPFCTECQTSSTNKKDGSKNPLKPKAPFKCFCFNIIPLTEPKRLISDTTFYNYLFTVDVY